MGDFRRVPSDPSLASPKGISNIIIPRDYITLLLFLFLFLLLLLLLYSRSYRIGTHIALAIGTRIVLVIGMRLDK